MNTQPARTPESPVPPRRALCGDTVNRLLTADEVAKCLGVTARWVYHEAGAGRMPHNKIGRYVRFRPESIDDWLARGESASVTPNVKRPGGAVNAPGPA